MTNGPTTQNPFINILLYITHFYDYKIFKIYLDSYFFITQSFK